MRLTVDKLKNHDYFIIDSREDISESYNELKPGSYSVTDVGGPFRTVPAFKPSQSKDNLINFNTGVVPKIIDISSKFFNSESDKVYKELGISKKIGMLFYGPQGTGKTCTCTLIMNELTKIHNAICLVGTGQSLGLLLYAISLIRKVQNNPIVLFVDEVENAILIQENSYLTFLDGSDSIDNLMFIGCTNYPDKIPDRIKRRKSRIKYTFEIKALPFEVYKEYIINKIPAIKDELLNQYAYLASEEGLTIDELKHSIIDYRLEGIKMEDSIKGVKTYNI